MRKQQPVFSTAPSTTIAETTRADLAALERADLRAVYVSWYQWKARMLNRLFDSLGQKTALGLTGSVSQITPATVRHGERFGLVVDSEMSG